MAATSLKSLYPDGDALLETGDQTVAGVITFSQSPIVPTPTTDMQAATKKYCDNKALTSNTTVNFTYDMTAAQIQALINAQSKNLNGYTLTFQFGDGTYNTGMTTALSFRGFYSGLLEILGNTSEVNASTLHTTQAVYLDFSAGAVSGIYVYDTACRTVVKNLKVRISDTAGAFGIGFDGCAYSDARYNYVVGAGKTAANRGIMVIGTICRLTSNYVSNVEKGIRAFGAFMYSETNDDTGTAPNYGLAAEGGSTISKGSTQPAGTTANETSGGGAVIR